MSWITDRKPTVDDANTWSDVWVCYESGEVEAAKYWSVAAREECVAWRPKESAPEPYVPPKSVRQFFDGTTYNNPAMFLHNKTSVLWHGPTCPESNLHWGRMDGYDDGGRPIWVYSHSELPDGDYTRIEPYVPPKPVRRHHETFDLHGDVRGKYIEVLPGDPPDWDAFLEAVDNLLRADSRKHLQELRKARGEK